MNYDFSLLPASHRRRGLLLCGLAGFLVILYVVGFWLHRKSSEGPLGLLAVIGLASFVGASLLQAYRDDRAVRRFIEQSGLQPCDEAALWGALPSCFSVLRDDPELVDVRVQNGYVFTLGSGKNCLLYEFVYTEQKGKRQQQHLYSIVAMEEAQDYSHLFLDGKQNGVSTAYSGSQRLALEGDFDDYFNLYVPADEQTDALVVFTPDVMQVLVQNGRPYDVELQGSLVNVIGRGGYLRREVLPSLLRFTTLFDQQLSEQQPDWSGLTMAGQAKRDLAPRAFYESPIVLWLGLAAIVAVCTSFWMR